MNSELQDLPCNKYGGYSDKHQAVIFIVCLMIQYQIETRQADLEDTSLWDEHIDVEQLLDKDPRAAYRSGAVDALQTKIIRHCRPVIERFGLKSQDKARTLDEYHRMPTCRLRLTQVDGQIQPLVVSGPVSDGWGPNGLHATNFTNIHVPDGIAYHPSTDLWIQLDDDLLPPFIRGEIKSTDGKRYFFKPNDTDEQFLRETNILLKIFELGLARKIRTSNIAALVYTDDRTNIIGVLIEWNDARQIGDMMKTATHDDLARWKTQVLQSVEKLHQNEIVWGDVNLGNILIDADSNAWVVDYGGLYNPRFVDEENCETKVGDLQGVQRVFAHLAWEIDNRLTGASDGAFNHS
ncbi:hypothetical protein ANO11243_054910 [Dothideomycetidae sp. 11243]|nr:hypothetical protein ANO11243_054910 [fungal sp. No.11243]